MRSDIIHVSNDGTGVDRALTQAEAVAAFKALDKKSALHLRLLTEETMGMMRALTGKRSADFWIDDDEGSFILHLKTVAEVNAEMRKNLLKASTSGQNAAAKGIMGKIRDLFERSMEPLDGTPEGYLANGWLVVGAETSEIAVNSAYMWSLNKYKAAIKSGMPDENWDELEKSIVANLADEIEVGIKEGVVEMKIYKKF